MARRSNKTKKSTVGVDFTGVETRVLLPEGIYTAVVDEVKQEEGDKAPYLAWKFKTIDDDPKLNDKPLYNNTSLAPQSLWVLAQLLDTLGVERPEGAMEIDLEELKGLEIGLVVEHEEYQGKTRAKVVDFTPATEEGDEEEEVVVEGEEEEGEEEELYTEEQVNEMDADELDALVKEHELDVKKSKKLSTYRAKVIAALEEAELIGEEEEVEGEEEEEGEEGELYTEEQIKSMSREELVAVITENELDVKLGKNMKNNRSMVIDALEEAELLGEEE